MKKFAVVLLSGILCLLLFACASSGDNARSGFVKCSALSTDGANFGARAEVILVAEYDKNGEVAYISNIAFSSSETSLFDVNEITEGLDEFPESFTDYNGIDYTYKKTLGYMYRERTIVEYSVSKRQAIVTHKEYANIDIDGKVFDALEKKAIGSISRYNDYQGEKISVSTGYTKRTKETVLNCDLTNAPYIKYVIEK